MAHYLTALVGESPAIERAVARQPTLRSTTLPLDGFALIALPGDLRETLKGEGSPALPQFGLTPAVSALAAHASHTGSIAFNHTDFYPGSGFQLAAVWKNGSVIYGPEHNPEEPEIGYPYGPIESWPINQAAAHLGIESLPPDPGPPYEERDAFTRLGLGLFRATDYWLRAAEHPDWWRWGHEDIMRRIVIPP